MPFREHKGSGKGRSRLDTSSMEGLWDSYWAIDQSAYAQDLAVTTHWRYLRELLPPAPARVLEGGCGLAQWVRFLADRGYEACGVDFAPATIERVRERWPDLTLQAADLRDLPFPDEFFDAIVSFGAVEHDEDGPEAILRELRRVLKPGGLLYCTVPCMNYLRRMGLMALQDWLVCNPLVRRLTGRSRGVVFYEYVFTPGEYAGILRAAGFRDVCVRPLAPPGFLRGRDGGPRSAVLRRLHLTVPWLLTHMVAGICRKNGGSGGLPSISNVSRRSMLSGAPWFGTTAGKGTR